MAAFNWLGLLLLGYVLAVQRRRGRSYRLWGLVVVLLALCLYQPLNTFKFFLVGVAALALIETYYGKLNALAMATLLVSAPIFNYFTNVFTFPIRLQLSQGVAFIISKMNLSASISGNLIEYKGESFSVDEACTGLQMMTVSYLMGIFWIAFFQRQSAKQLRWWAVCGLMAVIFGLNIFCNLCRMVLLVLFQSPPNTFAHEAIGLGCLVVYIFVPLYFITKWTVNFSKTTWHVKVNDLKINAINIHRTSYLYVMGLVCGVIFAVFRPNIKLENNQSPLPTPTLYHHKKLEHGVTQYTSSNKLVYLKNIPSFYYTDHSPLLCWRGSGYQLSSYREIVVHHQKVFVSTLCSNKSKLYTAWWFSNGLYRTNSQLDFRWRMLSGAPDFYVVNVTASTPSQLTALIAEWQSRF